MGKVVFGTVSGDVRDIGKNLVGAVLAANSFEVHDVGIDAPVRRFIDKAEEVGASVIAPSCLMSSSLLHQKDVIQYLVDTGCGDCYYVIVGGGPVTPTWAAEIGANECGRGATQAVEVQAPGDRRCATAAGTADAGAKTGQGGSAMGLQRFLEVLDRAHCGPVCSVKDWDTKVIPGKVAAALQKHGLAKTCRTDNPINTDDTLADQFFEAGFELAVETGVLCIDTERVIEVSREELRSAIDRAPAELEIGEGQDRVVIRARQPEDGVPPKFIAPLGIEVSEEIWVPLMQGIAEQRDVDIMQGGSLKTVFGRPIRSGTPYETLAGRLNAQLNREALWRAGRPGMPTTAVISSPTVFGQMGGYGIPGGFRSTDIALALAPSEMKTTYATLHKVAHALNCGGLIMSGSCSMIGGYGGPPEGAVIASIAWALSEFVVHQGHLGGASMMDVRYMGNCGRHAQWAISVQRQALSRNTHLLVSGLPNQVAGPCTDMLLYESAVAMMNLAVSGTSLAKGPRSAGGKYSDYLTPLECGFCGHVIKRCAGMPRAQANEITKYLIPKYEDRLMNPPKGQSFAECYDVRTLKPSQEWLDTLQRVSKELIALGMPLQAA